MDSQSDMHRASLGRRATAEALGTALLLSAVVGSGIMGERLASGNSAIALLANSIATGAALLSLIVTFGSISGAHFNPTVSLANAFLNQISWSEAPVYIGAQVVGAIAGVAAANVMFELPPIVLSNKSRTGVSQLLSEFIATFGLLVVILACSRIRTALVPVAIAGYIVAAYWFTSSTSFANPAVTIARTLSNTFSGIRPTDAAAFIAAQVLGAGAATLLLRWLMPVDHNGAITIRMDQPIKSIQGLDVFDGKKESST